MLHKENLLRKGTEFELKNCRAAEWLLLSFCKIEHLLM